MLASFLGLCAAVVFQAMEWSWPAFVLMWLDHTADAAI